MSEAPAVWYLPEQITHLYYSPVYATLSTRQKLTYNRLHACYLCEMFVFFEETLPQYYPKAASAPRISEALRAQMLALAASEKRHAAMFRTLARHLSPVLYSEFKHHFVRIPAAAAALIRVFPNFAAFFPTLLWIALIQEERAVFYGNLILREAEHLDPDTVDVQRRHLDDETEHLGIGEALLALYWDSSRPWIRRLNGRILRFVFREFLIAPKRGGARLIDQWLKECPELAPRKSELAGAMRALAHEPRFHESLYSRSIVPKTFELFDRYAEFRDLGESLWGYSPMTPEVNP